MNTAIVNHAYITSDDQNLFVLLGARGTRSYHLTVDKAAAEFVNSCTDMEGTISFDTLCGRTLVDLIVQDHTRSAESVCHRCAAKAVKVTR